MPRTLGLLTLAATLLATATAAPAQDKGKDDFSVTLQFSVQEYDSAGGSKATVKAVFLNNSKGAVMVPITLGSPALKLQGGGVWLVQRDAGKAVTAYKEVTPGQELVLFEESLDELLLGPGKGKEARWDWTWDKRPAPPLSPIHDRRDPKKLVPEAAFSLTVLVGEQKVQSPTVTLKVKGAGK
jgi:hypothetical protein